MLKYQCDICADVYEAHLVGGRASYMVATPTGTRLVVIQSDDEPCENCSNQIAEASEAKKLEIRQRKGQYAKGNAPGSKS